MAYTKIVNKINKLSLLSWLIREVIRCVYFVQKYAPTTCQIRPTKTSPWWVIPPFAEALKVEPLCSHG